KTRLFHWQNRTVLHVTRTRVAIRTRHGPAVGAAAAIALARHVTAPVSYPSGAINERSAAEFPGYRRNHQAAWDWSHTSHALPRGSLHREIFSLGRVWQEWRDSNPRPSVLETDALPTELHSCGRVAPLSGQPLLGKRRGQGHLGPPLLRKTGHACPRDQSDPRRPAVDGLSQRHFSDGRQPRRRRTVLGGAARAGGDPARRHQGLALARQGNPAGPVQSNL